MNGDKKFRPDRGKHLADAVTLRYWRMSFSEGSALAWVQLPGRSFWKWGGQSEASHGPRGRLPFAKGNS